MNRDELFAGRVEELARLADRRGCVTFTDFLDLNEQNILHQTLQKFSWIKGETFGGYKGAERVMAAFLPDLLYQEEWSYPISCLKIAPQNARFAEKLGHRDILGSLMHLGIERSRMGDIALCEGEAYLFCASSMAETICRDLTRVRHTPVCCTLCDPADFTYEPARKKISGSVASVRLDAVMAVAFQSSRSSLLSMVEEGKVFVNGRLITTNAYQLKEQDTVSVRGLGKFRFTGISGQTKKGRCVVELEKYI